MLKRLARFFRPRPRIAAMCVSTSAAGRLIYVALEDGRVYATDPDDERGTFDYLDTVPGTRAAQ